MEHLEHLSAGDNGGGCALGGAGVVDHGRHGRHRHCESWICPGECRGKGWVASSAPGRRGVGRGSPVEGVQYIVQLGSSAGAPVLFVADAQDEEEDEDNSEAGEAGAERCPIKLDNWTVGRLYDGLAVLNFGLLFTEPGTHSKSFVLI